MKEHRLKWIGVLLALLVYLINHIMKIDLFETAIGVLETFEKYELDEFIIPLFIFFIFLFFDQAKRKRSERLEHEKIKIYKAMLSSTHHILNNFLNQMQLFKMTAENTKDFDPEILSLYDDVIEDASTQIEALGSITSIDEVSIHNSVKPK